MTIDVAVDGIEVAGTFGFSVAVGTDVETAGSAVAAGVQAERTTRHMNKSSNNVFIFMRSLLFAA